MPAAGGLAFAAAHGVVHRVHGHAPDVGPFAQPAFAPGLAQGDVFLLHVAQLADGGPAVQRHHAHLAGRQLQMGVLAFLGHQLGGGARGPGHLPALAGLHLHVVHQGAGGNIPQGQGIPRLDVRFGAGDHHVAHLQILGGQDVALLPVHVMQQGNAGRAVGVVFDGGHLGRHLQLVPLEVDEPVAPLVPPAPVAAGDPAVVVPAAGLFQGP